MKSRSVVELEEFPNGSCLYTDQYFYVTNGSLLRVITRRVLESWSFPHVIHTTNASIAKMPVLGVLGFRPGTMIFSLEDGKYYLIEGSKKRQVVNMRWFDALGLNMLDAVPASIDEVKLHKNGEVLN